MQPDPIASTAMGHLFVLCYTVQNVACAAADCATQSAPHISSSIEYLNTKYIRSVCINAVIGSTCFVVAVVASKLRVIAYDKHRVCYTILLSCIYKCCFKQHHVKTVPPYDTTLHHILYRQIVCCRPYSAEYTGSHLNSEVKQWKARLVLGWGTPRELLRVLTAFSRSIESHQLYYYKSTRLQTYHIIHRIETHMPQPGVQYPAVCFRTRHRTHIKSIALPIPRLSIMRQMLQAVMTYAPRSNCFDSNETPVCTV